MENNVLKIDKRAIAFSLNNDDYNSMKSDISDSLVALRDIEESSHASIVIKENVNIATKCISRFHRLIEDIRTAEVISGSKGMIPKIFIESGFFMPGELTMFYGNVAVQDYKKITDYLIKESETDNIHVEIIDLYDSNVRELLLKKKQLAHQEKFQYWCFCSCKHTAHVLHSFTDCCDNVLEFIEKVDGGKSVVVKKCRSGKCIVGTEFDYM